MRSRRLLSLAVLAVSVLLIACISFPGGSSSRAFLAAASATPEDEAPVRSNTPLDWLHYDVILASRTSYPLALMFGFNCYGNVLLRKESGDKPYPTWIFGWMLGFVCYTYPGAIFSDLLFVSNAPLRAMSNNNILMCFSFWYLVIQNCDSVYKFLNRKHVFILLTTWWLADATRASLLFLERAVTEQPVFARGVWQAFIWCGAGPIARLIEKSIRGLPVPSLDKVQPNTLNLLKFPLIAMFWNMIGYLVYFAYLSDCNLFAKEGALTMVQCGAKHQDVFAFCTYLPCLLHLGRAYYALYSQDGQVIFGDGFCMPIRRVSAKQHNGH
mmetsp:Transcript_73499/g.118601  ORF Transcript_73499/g.118601 Transcript_73499/m.118601 type:complete len:326 (+) Transcript_73499:71-1048(+)|eukprot:CAMPEP_0115061936 /NCGR_PEP_ID=MMETSP0227-20121206/8277_1 /TAXON_ID=89957 /ORGANISM="Polarella glacialis, Strain CCMP 1383" /LENGTH=325 /DNA_ID=CAMNT_0002447279 /DNA_START=6 /DNA_END=983 /DNA_ORIENTATION=-